MEWDAAMSHGISFVSHVGEPYAITTIKLLGVAQHGLGQVGGAFDMV